jgi:glycine cleavage system regulatory protein
MARVVLTLIGDDQAGLVDSLSGVIADHGGNWERSHLAELAGKFAGIVQITVPDLRVTELVADLEPLRKRGLLDITAERAFEEDPEAPAVRLALHLVGVDQPGIVHDVAHSLATLDVSIETLETTTSSAPMSGDTLFTADALLVVPAATDPSAVTEVLERLAHQLMVDIDVHPDTAG